MGKEGAKNVKSMWLPLRGHLFYDLFLQGGGAWPPWPPLDPLLETRIVSNIIDIGQVFILGI